MKSFHDIRLTAAVGSDVECEVAFRTDVVRTRAGAEYRNGLLSQPRHNYRWSVARASTELEDLRQFHGARKGSKYAFRFKDPFDNTLPLTVISTGSAGTEFNIVKRYAAGGSTFERRILLLDTSQTTVYVGTTALASTDWNITTAYQLHLNVAPGAGKTVSVQGIYDVPVRFDSGFAARLASPDADEVEVELTEARHSPTVTFSTGSTWSPQACNVFDSTFYFFDTFRSKADASTSLSTNWALSHMHEGATTYLAGTTLTNTTVSDGFFQVPALSALCYIQLHLLKPLHPPFRVRQWVSMRPLLAKGDGYSNYITRVVPNPYLATHTTVAGITIWWPTSVAQFALFTNAVTTYVDTGIVHSTSVYQSMMMDIRFTTAAVSAYVYPSSGGSYYITTPTTAMAASSMSTCYLMMENFSWHGYKLDWIEVKSL